MDKRELGDDAQDPSISSHPPQPTLEQQLEQHFHPDFTTPDITQPQPPPGNIDPSQQHVFDLNSNNLSSTQTESSGQTQLQPDFAHLTSHEASASTSGPMVDRPPSNGPFSFTPEELMNLIDPKSPETLVLYGGVEGVLAGLHADPIRGLSTANRPLSQVVDESEKFDQGHPGGASGGGGGGTGGTFAEREEFFGRNVLPKRKPKSIFKLMWIALHEKILVSHPWEGLECVNE